MKRIALLVALLVAAPVIASDLEADATATILIGPIVDSADATAETGLTISQADVRLSKNGGNMAQKNETTSCTHDELGMYSCPLDATDTNTEGVLTVTVGESGTMVWRKDYSVLSATYFAAKYTGIEDSADIAAAVWDEATSGHTTAGTFGAQAKTVLDNAAGDAADAKTAAESVETTIGAAGAGLTEAGGTGDQLTALATAAALATVDTEVGVIDGIVDDILVDTGTTIPGTITTIDNEIAVIDGNVDDIELVLGTPTDTDIATDIANVLAEFAIIDVKSMQGIDVCITSGGAFTSENSSNCP